MRVGDLVMHMRNSKAIGIITAIHTFPNGSHWADVWWNDLNATYKERMRSLRVVAQKVQRTCALDRRRSTLGTQR
jgi:hypothetical protein